MATKEVKEFCAHNLVAIIINDIKEYFPDEDENQMLSDFTSSKTYSQLFNIETGLWAEDPDYILDMYFEEKGIKIDGGVWYVGKKKHGYYSFPVWMCSWV